jgi:hypothetical protein
LSLGSSLVLGPGLGLQSAHFPLLLSWATSFSQAQPQDTSPSPCTLAYLSAQTATSPARPPSHHAAHFLSSQLASQPAWPTRPTPPPISYLSTHRSHRRLALRLPYRAASPLRLPTPLVPSRLKRSAITAATTGRHHLVHELPPPPYKGHREHPRTAPPLLTPSFASLFA